MSAAGAPPEPGSPDEASVPEGLVSAVVNLVGTGPVLLGAYTIAELTAVDAIVDFLEARPSDEVLARRSARWPLASSWWRAPAVNRCRYGETWASRSPSSSGPGSSWTPG